MAAAERALKPASVSKIEEAPEGRPSGFWERWIGKRMVFQTKGRTIITGTLKEFRNTFLFIENAQVTGLKKRVNPNLVALDRNFISHFHEECLVEDVEGAPV